MSTYRGFSTVNALSQKKFKLTDFELIKQDLLNTMSIPRGSRLMIPREGFVIWELLYEPFTESIKEQITENLFEIVKNDPRIKLQSLDIVEQADQSSITIELNLIYNPTNQLEKMILSFSNEGMTRLL